MTELMAQIASRSEREALLTQVRRLVERIDHVPDIVDWQEGVADDGALWLTGSMPVEPARVSLQRMQLIERNCCMRYGFHLAYLPDGGLSLDFRIGTVWVSLLASEGRCAA